MPRVKLSKELKTAISALSDKEKDKLLFRLVAKDPQLVDQLEFQLLEQGETLEDRRADIKYKIGQALHHSRHHFYSPGYLLLDLRAISGRINHHVKTTKDKYGEIELNFFLLNTALDQYLNQIMEFRPHKSKTLDEYVVKRAMKLMQLLSKLHEDLLIEFSSDMQQLGQHIQSLPNMTAVAKRLGLALSYLKEGELPEE